MMVPHTGVWKRGFTLAQMPGMALWADMDSVVRAPGRIVVSVEAVADVSTTAMSTLLNPDPRTALPSGLSTSAEFFVR